MKSIIRKFLGFAIISAVFPQMVQQVSQATAAGEHRKIIIDTDAGVDDVQAILMILTSPNIDIIAITCVDGNIDPNNVTRNVLRVLSIANRLDIPVYRGAISPLISSTDAPDYYFGYDGLGDVDPSLLPEVNLSLVQQEPAVTAMVRLAKQFPNQITVLCIAPLTNIALASRLDPNFTKNLRDMLILGGNNAGEGNMTPAAEFNFYHDAEAASIVINNQGCPLTIVNLEACFKVRFEKDFLTTFYDWPSPQGRFIHHINQLTNDKAETQAAEAGQSPVYNFADEVAAAILLDDMVCAQSAYWSTEVELTGKFTRGQCVMDKRNYMPKNRNLRNCHTPNVAHVKRLLQSMLEFDFSKKN